MGYQSIDEFNSVSKRCHTDNHCELLDIGYSVCGRYISMVYSKLAIAGKNRAKLLQLASDEAAHQKHRYYTDINFQEICPTVMPLTTIASCHKKTCVKEYLKR